MMELDQTRPENPAMTFDEVSMERSKSFIKALQELKSLRPQLYSAAEYCEKSYLHSEQKQTVLDNLKDYAVRALVNAVDHLGTVAYKLTDLLEQQTLDISTMEVTVSCLNQQFLTCQTYTDKGGLRQQQLVAFIPRHHKHYILPNSVNKKVHFSPQIQTDARQNHFQARSRLQLAGSPASKTLSWHLVSETKSTLKGTLHAMTSNEDAKTSGKSSAVFQLLGMYKSRMLQLQISLEILMCYALDSMHADEEESRKTRSSGGLAQLSSRSPAAGAIMPTFDVPRRELLDASKPLTAFRSFDNPRHEIVRAPVRSKSMLSAFFLKQKTPKLKAGSAS
ncbi:PREDICTED: protein ABIL1-like isoform X1 [Populus euphratica]|uniref:Protein ABIL1-like isoform X1 n=1 Tax=Populus euphratica TaxID=75702 RepID=A0AAJ6XET1_POPEU|nr:PREDICTED: protein ABIL1-like isoform X1 [Populus euphratica]XP_011023255.1 PREDICTED: protein ABIL1-like isoform X1 [Populus euphratica]